MTGYEYFHVIKSPTDFSLNPLLKLYVVILSTSQVRAWENTKKKLHYYFFSSSNTENI